MRPDDPLGADEIGFLLARLPLSGPVALESQTAGTPPITDPTAALSIHIDVPFVDQREDYPEFGFQGGDYRCFYASKAMVENTKLDGDSLKVHGPNNRFQMAIRQNPGGTVDVDPKDAEAAVGYLDGQLEVGHPVVVGVNYADTNYDHENADGITDHFVVINGRTGVGPGAVYAFLDPWAKDAESAKGEFALTAEFKLVYESASKGAKLATHYEVTMVRVNG